jgi:hypothetical protein
LDKNKIIKIYLVTAIPELWYKKVGGGDETNNAHNPIGFIIDTNSNPKYGIIVGQKDKIQKRRMDWENKKQANK